MSRPATRRITHGLIIDTPWIDLILDGQKTWEMRSRRTTRRGLIGLIRKGSGQVVGAANLTAVHGPLVREELSANFDRHRVSAEVVQAGGLDHHRVAWELRDACRLSGAVPYHHPPGAVIWVVLDDGCACQLEAVLAGGKGDGHRDRGLMGAAEEHQEIELKMGEPPWL
jgi:hypothetical protein